MKNALIAIALVLLAALPTPALADQDDSQEAKERLKLIEKELSGAKNKVKQAAKKEESILGQLEDMDRKLAAKRTEVRKLEGKLDSLSADIARTEVEIELMEARLADRREELRDRLAAMYKTHRMGGPWLIMVSGEYGTLMKRYKYLSVMSERDRRMMADYEAEIRSLEEKKAGLASTLDEYDSVTNKRRDEARKVSAEERRKKELLASVRKQKGSYTALVKELQDASERMKSLIKELEEAASRAAKLPPGEFPPLVPGLDWPVDGKVTSRFGRQKHPKFDTYIDKKGIELSAPMGSRVHAVESAEVVYTDWFKGMGLVAILRHGGNYYTVYAHLADIAVRTGDKVAKGQIIATLGDTGTGRSPTLYFELRIGSEPLDPLSFLKKR